MSTFVYNDGSFEPEKKGVLSVTFGLFFDGTKTIDIIPKFVKR